MLMKYQGDVSFDPVLAASEALDLVQLGYDTRVGQDGGGSKSPETEEQREFVAAFAREVARRQ